MCFEMLNEGAGEEIDFILAEKLVFFHRVLAF